MPPPLGAGGIMFSGCPSVRPSVRPSEAWNNLFSPVHGSVGPFDQPWPFCGMSVRPSVRPSGEVSGHLPENALREWSKILHADVSWAPSELIRLWSWSVDFPRFGVTLTYWNGSNLGFPGISRRTRGGNCLKFCVLMYHDHLQNCNFGGFFYLVKWVKFWVSGHFLENPLRKRPEIVYGDVSWAPSELVRLWSYLVDCSNFGTILTW